MVQFKFSGSKSKEKDVPSNYGYGTKGFYFIDYFRADKETKLKYLDKIDFSINI